MASSKRWRRLMSVSALAAGLALLFAAYGVSATRSKSAPAAKHFTNFRAIFDAIDYMDPAQAYTGQSWDLMYNVYQTLVTYKHVPGKAGGQLVPGLAQAMPKISNGGKTYTFTLRPGLRYSNGKPVKASDF